ncbi:DNA polymerase delta subunit 3 [[Candida] zeylanoides]
MTMDMSSTDVDFLTGALYERQDPVTYRSLARALGIHHARAKILLYEFYQSHKDKLRARFVVSGEGPDGTSVIRIVDEDGLDDSVLSELKQVHTVHVYCLTSKTAPVSDAQLTLHERSQTLDYAQLTGYFHQGLIEGPAISEVKPSMPASVSVVETQPRKTSVHSNNPASKAPTKSTPSAGLTSGYVSRKSAKPAASRKASDEKSQQQSSSEPASKSGSISGYQYQSRKAKKLQPKEKVVISHGEDPEEPEETTRKSVTNTNSEELQKLFEDDDSGFSDNEEAPVDEATKEPIIVESKAPELSVKQETETVEPVNVGSGGTNTDVAPESTIRSQIASSTRSKSPSAPPQQSSEPEKSSYIDEDGYMVTINKPIKPSPTTSAPSAKRSSPVVASASKDPKKKKTGQSSLMNFFQKK